MSSTKSVGSSKSVDETSLYKTLLPSIWPSIAEYEWKAYRVEVVLVFDEGDTFWESPAHRDDVSKGLPFDVNFIFLTKGESNHIPFNDASRCVYEYGADYIVHVHDDSYFNSSGWITKGIDSLASFNPPNVGVVGRSSRHNMVHRTHLEIFEGYYPDYIENFWSENWISMVYDTPRTKNLDDWVVEDLVSHGAVDENGKIQLERLRDFVDLGRDRIKNYLATGVKDEFPTVFGTLRIAMVAGPMEMMRSHESTCLSLLVDAARLAQNRNPYGRYAVIQLLDRDFVTMTKHWICNVRRFGVVLSVVVFVATDEEAYQQIREFDPDLNVLFFPFVRPKNTKPLEYGQIAYYELMSFRTRLLSKILSNDIAFMIVESDAVWNSNVLQDIAGLQLEWNSFDMLSGSDDPNRNRTQGGFQLNRPTQRSKTIWGTLHNQTVDVIVKLHKDFNRSSSEYVGHTGNEQNMMDILMRTLGQEIGHKAMYLPATIMTSGLWYNDQSVRDKIPAPSVILFNFVMGTDSKIARAKANGHWFLDEHNMACYDPDPTRRNTFRATIVVLAMDRFKSFERLLESLTAADYAAPSQNYTNDIRLIIRIDRPKQDSEDFSRTVSIARNFTSDLFSSVVVEVQDTNKGLPAQWFTSFQDPRGWDEVGLILEDDLVVSPQFFRYLRLQWLYHWNNPLLGSISLQRQTLRASAPLKTDVETTIVNDHRPFLYRLIGSWGMSAKASTWFDFTTTYPNRTDVGIDGLITSMWYNNGVGSPNMWEQHFIHYLWKRNKFTHYVNLPNELTMATNWREPGVHFHGKAEIDFSMAKEWIESSMGALDQKLATYGFDTLPEELSH